MDLGLDRLRRVISRSRGVSRQSTLACMHAYKLPFTAWLSQGSFQTCIRVTFFYSLIKAGKLEKKYSVTEEIKQLIHINVEKEPKGGRKETR